eukprot:TRINITY_DN4105_c0_g3_i1.p1 TRINITY_DN4105_c0_g3~~TRINITY_DN4105_c0_g3_i1.p1  ORF type:complete len:444 (+),score=56.28 TRINITY_DN4105_c0_g3_i1:729-2060(+)
MTIIEGMHSDWIHAMDWATVLGAEDKCEHLMATASANGSVKIWKLELKDPNDQIQFKLLKDVCCADVHHVPHITWSPFSAQVALAIGKSSTLGIYDLDLDELFPFTVGHHTTITQIVWNSSGNRLLTSSVDGTIKVWSYRPLVLLERFLPALEETPAIYGIQLSPNSILCACLVLKHESNIGNVYQSKGAYSVLCFTKANITTIEEAIDSILSLPPPSSYWDILECLSGKPEEAMALISTIESRYINSTSIHWDIKEKALKLVNIFGYHLLLEASLKQTDRFNIQTKVHQNTTKISSIYLLKALFSYFTKEKRQPSPLEAASLHNMHSWIFLNRERLPSALLKYLEAIKASAPVPQDSVDFPPKCPYCEELLNDMGKCPKGHPVEFCCKTFLVIRDPYCYRCPSCNRVAHSRLSNINEEFDWLGKLKDCCPYCDSTFDVVLKS